MENLKNIENEKLIQMVEIIKDQIKLSQNVNTRIELSNQLIHLKGEFENRNLKFNI